MKHIVMFSGGAGSYLAAKRVVQRYPGEDIILLFADTLIEDEDLYRFLLDASSALNLPLVRLEEGRTPWQVFDDHKFIGNTRADLCSRILKRDVLDRWIQQNHSPEDVAIYVGISWDESHRYERLAPRKLPWKYYAPLCDAPYLSPQQRLDELASDDIRLPRLYGMGFAHNNCGGFCVKAGQAHFANLLRHMPRRYQEHEEQELAHQAKHGHTSTILRDRKAGKTKPLSMQAFRARLEEGGLFDKHEFGGCGCFGGSQP